MDNIWADSAGEASVAPVHEQGERHSLSSFQFQKVPEVQIHPFDLWGTPII